VEDVKFLKSATRHVPKADIKAALGNPLCTMSIAGRHTGKGKGVLGLGRNGHPVLVLYEWYERLGEDAVFHAEWATDAAVHRFSGRR